MRYFVCGDKLMAFNGKCGTSTMAWAIVRQFYPDIEEYLRTKVKWAAGTVDEQMHHNHVPKRTHPNAPVVQIMSPILAPFLFVYFFTFPNNTTCIEISVP